MGLAFSWEQEVEPGGVWAQQGFGAALVLCLLLVALPAPFLPLRATAGLGKPGKRNLIGAWKRENCKRREKIAKEIIPEGFGLKGSCSTGRDLPPAQAAPGLGPARDGECREIKSCFVCWSELSLPAGRAGLAGEVLLLLL